MTVIPDLVVLRPYCVIPDLAVLHEAPESPPPSRSTIPSAVVGVPPGNGNPHRTIPAGPSPSSQALACALPTLRVSGCAHEAYDKSPLRLKMRTVHDDYSYRVCTPSPPLSVSPPAMATLIGPSPPARLRLRKPWPAPRPP